MDSVDDLLDYLESDNSFSEIDMSEYFESEESSDYGDYLTVVSSLNNVSIDETHGSVALGVLNSMTNSEKMKMIAGFLDNEKQNFTNVRLPPSLYLATT